MGFLATIKGNRAYAKHAKGDLEGARKDYDEAYAAGLNAPKLLLTYSMLLLRTGAYETAVEVLRKAEKAPGLTTDQKNQVHAHYAVAIWKLGKLDRALELLREVFRKQKSGLTYGTLGFLLVEQGDAEEALAFNSEAVAYDDEDAVFLDNLAQTYYRLLQDKETARGYFEKALKIKPGAIDTNYFLAQYDVEEGKLDEAIAKLQTASEGRFSPLNYADREKVLAELEALRARAGQA